MGTGSILLILAVTISLGLITAGLVMSARKNKLQLLLMLMSGMGIVLALLIPTLQKFNAPLVTPTAPIDLLATQPLATQSFNSQPDYITLRLAEAAARGLVQFTVAGHDLANIELTLKLRGATPVEVVIPPGAIFVAESADLQNMMVRTKQRVWLDSSNPQETLTISVACINMERQVPTASDKLKLSETSGGGDLVKLLQLPNFQGKPFRIQQFAIWTITDNPARTEYVGISSGGGGSGPDDQEIQSIRSLFQQAGIESGKYRALQ